MHGGVRESYLESEALTAGPRKLHLMLIEGAIRAIEHGRERLSAGQADAACEPIVRAQEIVAEMLAALNHEAQPELTKKIAAVYVFVFRRLIEANQERSLAKLDDALRVLRVEQETWRQVVRQAASNGAGPPESTPPSVRLPSLDNGPLPDYSAGLSLEA